MAVRSFNGSTDELIQTVGTSLSGMTFGCIAVIIRFASVNSSERTWFGLHNSGGTNRMQLYNQSVHTNWWTESGSGSTSFTSTVAVDTWYLIVLRKASGTGAVYRSTYNFGTDTWSHANSGNFGNFLAAGAGGTIRMAYQTGSRHNGLIAARGVWADDVAFATSGAGNTALEAAGLESSLQAWVDAGVTSLWRYNQAAVTDAVDDLVGDANQSSRTGTTVVAGSDPPGLDFELGVDAFSGTIAWTEGDDTIAASGTVDNPGSQGTISWTEGDDTIAAAGTHVPPAFTGTIAWTEGDDALIAAGTVTTGGITGTISYTEADDTIAAAGAVDNTGAEVDVTVELGPARLGAEVSVGAARLSWAMSGARRDRGS